MTKRIFGLALSLCMLFSMVSGTAIYAENDNSALPEQINGFYRLDSADDLVWFANEVNQSGNRTANAILMNDIDLSDTQWTPIGAGYDYKNNGIVPDTAYNGVFDGNGYTVSNLNIKTKNYKKDEHYETYCQGLFGIIGKGGTVKNITVDGTINIKADGNEYLKAAHYVGGIAGINAGLILNCTNNAAVTGHFNVGGIAGAVGGQFSGGDRIGGKVINCVNNGDITATSTSLAHAGGITGQLSFGEISYAVNHGKVIAPYKEKSDFSKMRIVGLGGIVGSGVNADGSLIDRSYNDGQIGNNDGNYIAGIIGLNYSAVITNVYNAGTINGYNYSGGLVGYMVGGSVENAYNCGEVNTNTGYVLIGSVKNAKADNVYNIGNSKKLVCIEKDSETEKVNAEGVEILTADMLGEAFMDTDTLPIIDFSNAPNGEDEDFEIENFELENGIITITLDKVLAATNFALTDFDIEAYANDEEYELTGLNIAQSNNGSNTVVVITFDSVNAETELKVRINGIEKSVYTPVSDNWVDYRSISYSEGDGSKEKPYIISNACELALLSYRVNYGEDMSGKYFSVSNDIDLEGKQWIPIGTAVKLEENKYKGKAFNGNFDANNHKIFNIHVEEDSYSAGLFGLCEENAVIKNVLLYGEIKNTNASTHTGTGGIAGISYGTVYHCINYADINGASATGGIVGKSGAVNKTVTTCYIYRCGNEGSVTGITEAGGITAYNSGTVDECYNKGNVTAIKQYAGGVVGYNYEGSILLGNSYNGGTVTADTYAGGISGKAYKSEIKNSYNSGNVSAKSGKSGGILGYTVSDYRTNNCYYLENTAQMPYSENEGTGFEAKTEDELKALSGRLGNSFVKSDTFPVLGWENENQSDLADETSGLDISKITVTNGQIKLVMNKILVMTSLDVDDFDINGVAPKTFTQSNENNKTVVTITFTPFKTTDKDQNISVSVSYGENEAKKQVLCIKADGMSVAPDYNANEAWADNAATDFESGNGSQQKPYIIKTGEQLAYLAKTVNGGADTAGVYYKLANSIDITAKLWNPIGNKDNAFKGIFDGNGFEITFNADGDFDVSGLFGYTKNAEITMLGVGGLSRTESEISGGLIGIADNTTVSNCYSKVYSEATKYSGGFIGKAESGSEITNCYCAGYAVGENAGMLFGSFANGVSVKNLYYRISESKTDVGENASTNTTIASGKTSEYMQSDAFCYDLWLIKTKKVDGKTVKVEPVFCVGETYPVLNDGYTDTMVVSAEITSPGKKPETGAEHKFILTVYGKNIENISDIGWNASAEVNFVSKQSKLTVNKGIGKAEAVVVISETAEKNAELNIECTVNDKTYSVTFETANAPWSGKGTEKEPFEIKALSDLKALSEYVSNGNSYAGVHFKMTNDIDMTDDDAFSSIGAWYGLKSDDTGAFWENENNRAFCGTFDGNGYALKNAVLYAQNNNYGLFSYIGVGGTVKNVVLDKTVKLKSHNSLNYVGVLCGANFGTIKNCENNADMNFKAADVNNLSGICGLNYGTIENCKNTSDINNAGTSKAGICGLNYGIVKKCENTGKISQANNAGGIVAENRTGTNQSILLIDKFSDLAFNGEIVSCKNNGEITVTEDAGGIVADNYFLGTIDDCENNALVTGRMAGGIAGRSSGCYSVGGIKNSTNNGNVTANGSYGGGIVGEQINGLVYFCKNYGNVNGSKYAGGIAGRNYAYSSIGTSAVEFSENYGNTNGSIDAGIAGYYQDESGKCYVRYNYSKADNKYGIIGDIVSNYDLNTVICNNTWVSDALSGDKDTAKGDLPGIELISNADTELFDSETVTLSVDNVNLKTGETTTAASNKEIFSSDEDVISVDYNGNVTAVGIGKAYVYAASNPYTYSVALLSVSANPDTAEDIDVSFWLIGEENHGKDFVLDNDTENTYTTWIPKKTYTVKKGNTVGDLFKKVLDANSLKYQGFENGYIRSIENADGEWLGEFTNGKYSGWMYTVNGSHPDVGLNEYALSGGEEIVWHYVDDYRLEISDWTGTGEYAPIGDGSLYDRWLEADPNEAPSKDNSESGNNTSSNKNNGSFNSGIKNDVNSNNKNEDATNQANEKIVWFIDVTAGSWYEKAVKYAVENGLFEGISETEFAPEADMTRAMLVTVLYRLEKAEKSVKTVKFTDLTEDWYKDPIIWASENGIVNGISETAFAPNDKVTREQTAAILYRYAKYKGCDTTQGGMAIREFDDFESISEYALDAVAWAVNTDLINGMGDNTIAPLKSATRAEIAAIFMRFCENVVK